MIIAIPVHVYCAIVHVQYILTRVVNQYCNEAISTHCKHLHYSADFGAKIRYSLFTVMKMKVKSKVTLTHVCINAHT